MISITINVDLPDAESANVKATVQEILDDSALAGIATIAEDAQ